MSGQCVGFFYGVYDLDMLINYSTCLAKETAATELYRTVCIFLTLATVFLFLWLAVNKKASTLLHDLEAIVHFKQLFICVSTYALLHIIIFNMFNS